MRKSKRLYSVIALFAVVGMMFTACQPQIVEVEVEKEVIVEKVVEKVVEVEKEVVVEKEVAVEVEKIIEVEKIVEKEVQVDKIVEVVVEVAVAATFDWRQFEGATVSMLSASEAGMSVTLDIISEFEDLTGITVEIDNMPWPDAQTKRVLELASGSPSYDVMSAWVFQEKTEFVTNGWYEPLNQYIHDPMMTNPDWDWADFGDMARSWAEDGLGDIWNIPTKFDLWGMFARTSALEAAGKDFPLTIDELFDVVEAVHDPDGGMYGISARGIQGQNALYHSWFHLGNGGSWFDSAGDLNTKGEPSLKAIKNYARLLQYGPPGVEGFAWSDGRAAFTNGQAAFYFTGYGGSWAYMQDPEVAKSSGDVSYGFLPSTDANKPVMVSSQLGLMLNPNSENKGAAWYLLQWLTSKESHLRALLQKGDTWTRVSTYLNPEFLDSDVYIEEWADGLMLALSIPAVNILPAIPNAGEWRDDYGVIMNEAVLLYPDLDDDHILAQLEEANAKYVAYQKE